MIRNIKGLDHLVINVRERMDEARELYQRLGFLLTPLGKHSLGTINHLLVLNSGYIELLGYPPGAKPRGLGQFIAGPPGLVGCALATADASGAHRECVDAGLPAGEPLDFSRPVSLPGGSAQAAFRVVQLASEMAQGAMFFICQHFTPELVWRLEWQRHPNGALDIVGFTVVVPRPEAALAPYRTLFGGENIERSQDGYPLVRIGRTAARLVTAEQLVDCYGREAVGADVYPDAYMAALTLRVESLAVTDAYLGRTSIDRVRRVDRLIVPASSTLGVIVEFTDQPLK